MNEKVTGLSSDKKTIDMRILYEIIIVLGIMLAVKWIADYFHITGAGSIAMWVGILTATLFMKKPKLKWKELGLKLPKGRREWLINIGLALASVVIVILFMGLVLDPLVNYLGLETPPEAADRFAFFLGKPFVFISYLVGVVWFGAALGEELLMRGFLLNRLADLIGKSKLGWSLALFIHAIIFGMLHAYQGIPGIIGTTVVALIFGGIYFISKRKLFPVILGHGIINTISLTAYYLSNGALS